MDKVEFIARVRYIGWVAYQIAAGQEYNVRPNNDQWRSLIDGVKYAIEHPDMTPEENHENWMRVKKEQGWVYGEVKDFISKTHPDLVSFDKLPKIEADKDVMDLTVHEMADELWDMLKVPSGD